MVEQRNQNGRACTCVPSPSSSLATLKDKSNNDLQEAGRQIQNGQEEPETRFISATLNDKACPESAILNMVQLSPGEKSWNVWRHSCLSKMGDATGF